MNDMSDNDSSGTTLTPEQKAEMASSMALGLTQSEARYAVLTSEQKQRLKRQIREAARQRYEKNPYREIIKRARNSANSARRRGAKRGAHEFTITENDLHWPKYCPILRWIKLHYPGQCRNDPAGVSLDRKDVKKGYVPGNVRVISLRANVLRKDITMRELRAMAEFFIFPDHPDD